MYRWRDSEKVEGNMQLLGKLDDEVYVKTSILSAIRQLDLRPLDGGTTPLPPPLNGGQQGLLIMLTCTILMTSQGFCQSA